MKKSGAVSIESDILLLSSEKTPRYKHYDIKYYNCNFDQYDDFIFCYLKGRFVRGEVDILKRAL